MMNKAWLIKRYCNDGLSLKEIAIILSCSEETVRKKMKSFNIPRRADARRAVTLEKNHYTKEHMIARFEKKFIKTDNCWEWIGANNRHGYGFISFGKKTYKAHRFSLYLYSDFDLQSKLKVCHHCDNRKCVNPDHLYSGTQKDNMHDREARHRRNIYGERNPNTKLTMKIIKNIRHLASIGRTQTSIGKELKIPQPTISRIIRRVAWNFDE